MPSATAAAAAAAKPAASDSADGAPTTTTSSRHRVRGQRRGKAVKRRREAPPPHRPTVQDRRRALLARRAAMVVPPPALQKAQALPVYVAPKQQASSNEVRRGWKLYTAQAHMPVGSPREPEKPPPPARLLQGSRPATAAAADPLHAVVVELTGRKLTEKLPRTDEGKLCVSDTSHGVRVDCEASKRSSQQADGASNGPHHTSEASERQTHVQENSNGAAERAGDRNADAVGD